MRIHEEGEPQELTAEKAGCPHSAASKRINGNLAEEERHDGKRSTSSR